MTRIFLDANVIFSAAWTTGSKLSLLWSMKDVHLVTSAYARSEAERNIESKRPQSLSFLSQLLASIEIAAEHADLAEDYGLPEKDRPILESAIGSGCSILLTGDNKHFGHLIGDEIQGVSIMTVAEYLTSKSQSK